MHDFGSRGEFIGSLARAANGMISGGLPVMRDFFEMRLEVSYLLSMGSGARGNG